MAHHISQPDHEVRPEAAPKTSPTFSVSEKLALYRFIRVIWCGAFAIVSWKRCGCRRVAAAFRFSESVVSRLV
jgi:hypothetical protein